MGELVPFRSPAPARRGRALARISSTVARAEHPSSAPTTPPAGRRLTGFAVAFIDTQRDIGRGKRARRQAGLDARNERLRAEYQRAGRLSLPAPKPPELTP